MFTTIDRMCGMVQPQMGRQKSVAAGWTMEWGYEEERGEMLAWRLGLRP
jgi:hypothetical protein